MCRCCLFRAGLARAALDARVIENLQVASSTLVPALDQVLALRQVIMHQQGLVLIKRHGASTANLYLFIVVESRLPSRAISVRLLLLLIVKGMSEFDCGCLA